MSSCQYFFVAKRLECTVRQENRRNLMRVFYEQSHIGLMVSACMSVVVESSIDALLECLADGEAGHYCKASSSKNCPKTLQSPLHDVFQTQRRIDDDDAFRH